MHFLMKKEDNKRELREEYIEDMGLAKAKIKKMLTKEKLTVLLLVSKKNYNSKNTKK